jgi:hypothetical protein
MFPRENDARKLLAEAGYRQTRTYDWVKPTQDHKPTEKELSAIVYLSLEWDEGDLIDPAKGPQSIHTVNAAIGSELKYQGVTWGNTGSSDRPGNGERTLDEYILYIYGYAHELMMLGAKTSDPVEKLNFVRKVTTLGFRTMLEHGAPFRDSPVAPTRGEAQ